MSFRDHFSGHADSYVAHRPEYPRELFQYLGSITSDHRLAWDCGTGNGQAAKSLSEYFERVIATDASLEQLSQAKRYGRVSYLANLAEQPSLQTTSVDLITVAVAVHWFEFEQFYNEVRRVMRPEVILAVWAYDLPKINAEVDQIINRIYQDLSPYFPEGFQYIDSQYRTLPFPFEELTPPAISMHTTWTLRQLTGFIDSWSGTQKYLGAEQTHPLERYWHDLRDAWGDPAQQQSLTWSLNLRVGKQKKERINKR